ncbi:MAG: 3-deoxy-D-manno-octulosonic acid transferase [Deltaproteobacteria bacterium]|nr:3-deoxy-D-manno-octulosonic acid transferase [Deltaproteobacteria bacterium]
MIFLLYDILLHISVIVLLPYFVVKMFTARKYRDGIPERFGFIGREKIQAASGSPLIWIHAVSVGETKAVAPVVKSLKQRNPGVKILFSTVTRTGNATAAKDLSGSIDALIYFPLDLSWAIRRVARAFKPAAFVVIEKEIWPNIFLEMKKENVPVIILNGTISDRSHSRFLRFAFFFKEVFGCVSLFSARTEDDRKKAVEAGVKEGNARTAGNIKFDLTPPVAHPDYLNTIKDSLRITPSDPVIVAGSTHPGEEEKVIAAFKAVLREHANARLIIAPRHPERFAEVETLLKRSGLEFTRRSRGGNAKIVLLDTIGELMLVYSFSTIAFVGGSLVPGIGGHNLLEPAYYGKPVLWGPHLTTYASMAELLEGNGGGFTLRDENDFAESAKRLLSDKVIRERAGAAAQKVVEANKGAARKSVEAIEWFLKRSKNNRATL